ARTETMEVGVRTMVDHPAVMVVDDKNTRMSPAASGAVVVRYNESSAHPPGVPSMAISQPLKYLDKALSGLRDLNLVPEKTDEAPIIDLIEQISDLDEEKTLAIARTLS